jgi:hypothetical protein
VPESGFLSGISLLRQYFSVTSAPLQTTFVLEGFRRDWSEEISAMFRRVGNLINLFSFVEFCLGSLGYVMCVHTQRLDTLFLLTKKEGPFH